MKSLLLTFLVFLGGCVLHLDDSIACGDGYVDHNAGEQCDPADPSSYEGACVGTSRGLGTGGCNPQTCQILNDIAQCAFCGDGIIDSAVDEECDGDMLGGNVCPLGSDEGLRCDTCRLDDSLCEKCGNGVVDPGEQCDPKSEGGLLGTDSCDGLQCAVKPCSSGTVSTCKPDCTWRLTSCGYCGDGELDGAQPVDLDVLAVLSTPEVCDGEEIETSVWEAHCSSLCGSNLKLECSFACLDDCSGLDPDTISLPNPQCCRKSGQPCPFMPADIPCCYAQEHPNEPGNGCTTDVNFEVCR